MKSPISSVGIIELDGIRNGSATQLRRHSTAASTGKKARDQSTTSGSFASSRPAAASRRLRSHSLSASHTRPVSRVSTTRASSNQRIIGGDPSFVVDLQHGEEGLLRDLHPADLLHALL